MLDLTVHRFILRFGELIVCQFSNLPLAILTGYVRCSYDPKRRGQMLSQYTLEERGTGKREPITDYRVEYINGAYIYRGTVLN